MPSTDMVDKANEQMNREMEEANQPSFGASIAWIILFIVLCLFIFFTAIYHGG